VDELAQGAVLCHRDYHSRNLMLHSDSLCIIDFRMRGWGRTPATPSLLRDAYVDLNPQQVDGLIAFFLAHKSGDRHPADEFRRRFDLMALQRNLKALGTFGYMTTSRNNTVYIQYIPRTAAYVKANLAKYPRFARLRELLDPLL
jgi:aminoglycoside/choline kinase family phosphotransferase